MYHRRQKISVVPDNCDPTLGKAGGPSVAAGNNPNQVEVKT